MCCQKPYCCSMIMLVVAMKHVPVPVSFRARGDHLQRLSERISNDACSRWRRKNSARPGSILMKRLSKDLQHGC